VSTLKQAVIKHSKTFGKEFKGAAADRAYYDDDLIKVLEKKLVIDLAIPHKKNRDIKMKPFMQDLYDRRAATQAKISEGKRTCGLNKSYYKGYNGDRMWLALSIVALNIRKLLRDIVKSPELILRFTG
jgi:hypothetical protein